MEPVTAEMYEQCVVNVEANSYNNSSDTESASDGEMSEVDPLDSSSEDSNKFTVHLYMVEGLPKYICIKLVFMFPS